MPYIGLKTRIQNQLFEIHIPEETRKFEVGEIVIIETPEQTDDAKILYKSEKSKIKVDKNIKLLRKANDNDFEKISNIIGEEEFASNQFKEKVEKYKLDMKLLKTEISFDQKHLIYYFSAETRLDFRDLLKDLVRTMHKLIRLQQVGPRDEAKYIVSVGSCGRKLCCQSFLKKLDNVPSDLAKIQRLSQIASSKISGTCGKLMCCLAYEAQMYKDLEKNLPKIGDTIETKKGKGRVISHNIINQKVKAELLNGDKIDVEIKK
jgi:cell fate regulator YaaT (PSP1 superfamily)